MEVKIQKSTPEDWKTIQKLNNLVFENDKDHDDDLDLSWPFSGKGIEYYKKLASGKYGYCLLAFINKSSAGYIALALKDFGYRKSRYVEIENMGVVPKHRSKGIGKILIEEAVKWAKTKKATKLYVAAYWKNKKAINFYKKVGFSEMGLELEKKL